MPNKSSADEDPVESLAAEFIERRRRGACPSIDEYAERHPELADQIRAFFPALVLVEELKPDSDDQTGSLGGESSSGRGPIPERIGDFRILREIGRGGMGVVYEAEQESLGRRVALKVPDSPTSLDPQKVLRFRREARAAANLHHTSIVPVFGVGQEGGLHYYVMQFIPGLGLDEVLVELRRLRERKPGPNVGEARESGRQKAPVVEVARSLWTGCVAPTATTELADEASDGSSASGQDDHPLDRSCLVILPGDADPSTVTDSPRQYIRSVARIGVQVAEALDYAHQQGIWHRDIKPSNLLLDGHGAVWITDFGLAKVASDENLTHTGDIVGTARYMAPERFRGRCDARSDVYSLGLTLYELLTFRPAFAAEDRHDLIRQVTQEEPPRLRRLVPSIPRDLETIVHKAIARDPAHRYASAERMAEDLRRFLDNRGILARRSSPPERFWRWCHRNPVVASLNALAAVLTIAVAIISTGWALSLLRQRDALRQAQADTKASLASAYLAQADAESRGRAAGSRFKGLEAIRRAVPLFEELGTMPGQLRELRDSTIRCLIRTDLRATRSLGRVWPHHGDIDGVFDRYVNVVSGDGTLAGGDGTAVVFRVSDDTELFRLEGFGSNIRVPYALMGADGRSVAVLAQIVDTREDRLKVWRLDPSGPTLLIEDRASRAAAFSPDGRFLVYASPDGSFTRVACATGRRDVLPPCEGAVTGLAIHPDGRQLAVSLRRDGKHAVLVRPLEGARATAALEDLPELPRGLAWHPDGRRLAIACDDARIYLWHVGTPERLVLKSETDAGIHINFNHRGDLLLSHGWAGVLRLWDPDTGQQLLGAPATALIATCMNFSTDDRFLVGGALPPDTDRWQILEVADGRAYRTLAPRTNRGRDSYDIHEAIAVSPDGRLVAVGKDDGFRVWDLASGRELIDVPDCGWVTTVSFLPGGAMLTSGPSGLFEWQLVTDAASGSRRLTLTGRLPIRGSGYRMVHSRDGGVVAVGDPDLKTGVRLWHREPGPWHSGPLETPDVRQLDVSPDGRWVATSSWADLHEGFVIWDAGSGKKVRTLPVKGRGGVRFSMDGRWLGVCGRDGCYLFKVGEWEEARVIGRGSNIAFSPDNRLAALADLHTIELVEPRTGGRLARLEDPGQERVCEMAFGAGGAQLIVTSWSRPVVHIWDLRRIREGLADLGLDWDLPPYPSAPAPAPGRDAVAPIALEIPRALHPRATQDGP